MDIDGSLLALSLEDFKTALGSDISSNTSNNAGAKDQSHRHPVADDMDVDSDSDIITNNSIETIKEDEKLTPIGKMEYQSTSTPIKEDLNPDSQQQDLEIEPENSSFVSALSHTLFSPTNIGAKYAMKLLPAPESKDHDKVDYEYDTSLIKSADFPTRHINSFSSNSDNSLFLNEREQPEFVYNPAKKDYDEEIYNNSMNRSFLFRRYNRNTSSPSPMNNPNTYDDLRDFTNLSREDVSEYTNTNFSANINNHNNSNNNINSNTSGNMNASGNFTPMVNMSQMSNLSQHTPTSVQVHHHHYYYSPNKEHNLSNVAGNSFSQFDNTNYMSPINQLHSRFIEEIKLPPPWKQESSPKEKYSYIISTYLQLIINTTITVYGIYLIYNIIKTIRADIDFKLLQQSRDLLVEISTCKKNYLDNNCSPDLIVPALEKPCEYWSKCMNQDPKDFGNKSTISAETLGLIINSLIEPLGFKFFLIFFTSVTIIFLFNFTFGFIRAKSYYGQFNMNNDNDQGHSIDGASSTTLVKQ